MKKLIICSPKHGDQCFTGTEDITREFEKIMAEGYGGNIPPVFMAEYEDGSVKRFAGDSAKGLTIEPGVESVVVLSPLCGG